MIYIINECIAFRVDDGALYLIASNDSIVLPIPAQRLLLIILESDGNILRRDFLLQEVWDKFGFTGSNNNLNHYLSLLRRSFSAFGCEDLIETIPKVGIKLSESVHIKKDNNTNTVFQTSNNISPTETNLAVRAPRFGFMSDKIKILTFMVMLLLFASSLIVMFSDKPGFDQTPVTYLMNGNCRLVLFSELNDKQVRKIKNEVEGYLNETRRACHPGVKIYFDDISSQTLYGGERTLISYCESDKRGINDVCVNSFFSNGVKNVK